MGMLVGILAVMPLVLPEPPGLKLVPSIVLENVPLGEGGGVVRAPDRPYLPYVNDTGEGTRLLGISGELSSREYPIIGDDDAGSMGKDMYRIASSR